MIFERASLEQAIEDHGPTARVVIVETKGSTPRETGAAMLVWAEGSGGSIGGGTLEHQAIQAARDALVSGKSPILQRIPLGPNLGQCCGGSVTLVYEIFDQNSLPTDNALFARIVAPHASIKAPTAVGFSEGWLVEELAPERKNIWIWGAGHVGRALAQVLAPLPDFAVTLVDTTNDRLPAELPANVTPLVAADMPTLVEFAPNDAHHFIMTYDHGIDLALCHALLTCGNQHIGLIGSATKWARFKKRLAALGHTTAQINGIACPIGNPAAGKHPQAIAVSIAATLLLTSQSKNAANKTRGVA